MHAAKARPIRCAWRNSMRAQVSVRMAAAAPAQWACTARLPIMHDTGACSLEAPDGSCIFPHTRARQQLLGLAPHATRFPCPRDEAQPHAHPGMLRQRGACGAGGRGSFSGLLSECCSTVPAQESAHVTCHSSACHTPDMPHKRAREASSPEPCSSAAALALCPAAPEGRKLDCGGLQGLLARGCCAVRWLMLLQQFDAAVCCRGTPGQANIICRYIPACWKHRPCR